MSCEPLPGGRVEHADVRAGRKAQQVRVVAGGQRHGGHRVGVTTVPTVELAVCTASTSPRTSTCCVCVPPAAFDREQAVSVTVTVTDGTSAVVKPEASNFSLSP